MLPSALRPRSVATILRWYALAAALSVMALGLMLLLRPLMEPSVFFLFLTAVCISALYGGLGPGLVATILSALACDFFFLPPEDVPLSRPEEALRLTIFLATGVILSWLAGAHKRAKDRLSERNEDLLEWWVAQRGALEGELQRRASRNEEPPDPWRREAVGDDHLLIDANGNEIARFGAERPARLCAAAPKLLEAAKEARDELSQYVAPWMGRLAARLDEAFKKAEDQDE